MTKRRLKFILFWIFLILTFSFLALFLILEAYGFRLNRQTWVLEPTGVIILDGEPRQIKATINDKLAPDQVFPIRLAKLSPGQYDITIEKNDYQTWTKTFWLAGGQAIEVKNIELFLIEPKITETARSITLEELQKDFQLQGQDLEIKNNEIWHNQKLVTRFSENPSGAILLPGRNQIIFQLNSEIRVMEIDGTNNFRLISLPDSQSIAFAWHDNKLIYASKDKIWETQIK